MGIVPFLSLDYYADILDFESSTSFESVPVVVVYCPNFESVSSFDIKLCIVTNTIEFETTSILEVPEILWFSIIPNFISTSEFESTFCYKFLSNLFNSTSEFEVVFCRVIPPEDLSSSSELICDSAFCGLIVYPEEVFDSNNLLECGSDVIVINTYFDSISQMECTQVLPGETCDCSAFDSISELAIERIVRKLRPDECQTVNQIESQVIYVIPLPVEFDSIGSFECTNSILGNFVTKVEFNLDFEFTGGFPYEIISPDLISIGVFEGTYAQAYSMPGFELIETLECAAIYIEDFITCASFVCTNDLSSSLFIYIQLPEPEFLVINSLQSTLFFGTYVDTSEFTSVNDLMGGVTSIVDIVTPFDSIGEFSATTFFQSNIPSFTNPLKFECSDVFGGHPIDSEEFQSTTTLSTSTSFELNLSEKGFSCVSSFECTKMSGVVFFSYPFEILSSLECSSLYDKDYLTCPVFNHSSDIEVSTLNSFNVIFEGDFSIECFDAFVGTPVATEEFEGILEFEVPSSHFVKIVPDFDTINELQESSSLILVPVLFETINTLDISFILLGIGIALPYPGFLSTTEIELDTFFSLDLNPFSLQSSSDLEAAIIQGDLFPVTEFELVSELLCGDVLKVWNVFVLYKNSSITQGSYQIHSTSLVLYNYVNYFSNQLNEQLNFSVMRSNDFRNCDLQFIQFNSNNLSISFVEFISMLLSDQVCFCYHISNTISSDPLISDQYISNSISDFNFVSSQIISHDIEYFGATSSNGIASLWYDPPPGPQAGDVPVIVYIYFEIFIDGISVKERIRDINLTQRESDVISHIEIEFKDTLSFNMCDISQGTGVGTERIELRVGGDLSDPNKYITYKFLLEERSANESNHSFTIWGRQITALLAEPFSDPITQTFENRTSSSIAQELAGSISVDWIAPNYLNAEYNLDGTPLSGIQRLAEVINAVVRTKPDGSIIVRSKFPTRPADLIDGNCTVDITLDRYINIVSADYSEEQTQYNTVEVQGSGVDDATGISIVSFKEYNYNIVEEVTNAEQKSDFQIDDTAYLRIYHSTEVVYDPINQFDDSSIFFGYSLCTTFSSTSLIQLNNDEVIEDEVIDIINGTGNLSKNPTSISTWQWEGIPKFGDCQEDTVVVTFDGSNITAQDAEGNNVLIGKMKVTYTTQYDLFEITCDEEKEIIVATLTSEHLGVYLKITMDSVTNPDDEKPAPKVDDDLIISEAMALTRGESVLDDTYYRKLKYTIQIPYYLDVGLFDGDVVRMEDDFWNIIGNAIIRSADITISADDSGLIKVWQNIELHQYARP